MRGGIAAQHPPGQGSKKGEPGHTTPMWWDIAQAISTATGQKFRVGSRQPVGGGCINEAVCLQGDGQSYFVKLNSAKRIDMFEAEAAGLSVMAASESVRVPQPITWGISGDRSWLVLEHIDFNPAAAEASATLGAQLAQMHRFQAEQFGWERDNTIGSTPQHNAWSGDWLSFFAEHRLGYQLRLAGDNGAAASLLDKGERLRHNLDAFFDGYKPSASLLHGDLWAGNWGVDGAGSPVLFDPAVYYGDREADLAMTELFGGFDENFYRAYREAWPMDVGYRVRKGLYNLYHILNHFNLFGGGYGHQAEDMLDALLAQAN